MIAKTRKIADVLELTHNLPTIRYVKPKFVYESLVNSRFDKSEVYVKEGDKVKIGSVIGKRFNDRLEQNIHSTVSGTVKGIVKKFHRTGKLVQFIEIENDFRDEVVDTIREYSEEEISKLTREEIIDRIKENSVIGLGGSAFPTYVKFSVDKPIKYIVVNAVECEPYLTTDHRIVLEFPELIIHGLKYILRFFNAEKAYICVKKNKTDMIDVLNSTINRHPELPIEVARVGNYYPQGWEHEMIKSALGIKMERFSLPMDYGVMNFNVSTVLAIFRALKYNMPVIERNLTITGNGVNYPSNFRVRVGTSLGELLPLCGGYSEGEEKLIIMGGPMMGANLLRDDAVCTKSCTSVIILNPEKHEEKPCIRCASCVYSCPVGLQPVLIREAVIRKDTDALKKLQVVKCIECGLCSYSCTSKIGLVDFMRQGKKLAK